MPGPAPRKTVFNIRANSIRTLSPSSASEFGTYGAEAVQVNRHESQAAAQPVGARHFPRKQFIQGPPVQKLGKGIDQRQTLEPLIQNQFANQGQTSAVERPLLRQQVNIEQ